MGNLYVVRHGETDFNIQGRFTGSRDVSLNSTGMNQAKLVAEKLQGRKVDLIIASTLKRALQTANIIASCIDKPVITMSEFVERCAGVYEGLTREEVQKKYPELWSQNITRVYDRAPDGGESMREVRERVSRGLNYICRTYSRQDIVLVTHGYVSKEIHRYFSKLSEEEFFAYTMKNCEVAEYLI